MDVSVFSGPHPQRGLGVVAPFDFALDRELWRWVPDEISLYLTRTPFVPVEVSLDLARLVSEHQTLREAVRALTSAEPEVIAYACTSGSFVDGAAGERTMSTAMETAGEVPALTTSGALVEALHWLGARRIALVTPYTYSVTQSLEDFLGEAGITVQGCSYLGLTRHIWKVPYRDVVEVARQAVDRLPAEVDALFISCTNLPTYDAIPQLEAELRIPVLSANQVTMWSALRRMGTDAVGPYQSLLDTAARRMLVVHEDPPVGALPEVASFQDPPPAVALTEPAGLPVTEAPGFPAEPSGFPAEPAGLPVTEAPAYPAEPAGLPVSEAPGGVLPEPPASPEDPARPE
ncbi:decarboxylase [Streptomyces sp. KLOTTS4A1]|uniref:maleate cis-trans isomerase family protein n=1 Tax=Streptomyces sp. KLOTTS4A1 TaxID=3390996 RepID=UPI0039F536B2